MLLIEVSSIKQTNKQTNLYTRLPNNWYDSRVVRPLPNTRYNYKPVIYHTHDVSYNYEVYLRGYGILQNTL